MTAKLNRLIVFIGPKIIRFYQATLSPDHGPLKLVFPHGVCRYYPTCSNYAAQSINRYGWRGVLFALRRLARCHPFAAGGLDPVSKPKTTHDL